MGLRWRKKDDNVRQFVSLCLVGSGVIVEVAAWHMFLTFFREANRTVLFMCFLTEKPDLTNQAGI
jgi:hypothetical protein